VTHREVHSFFYDLVPRPLHPPFRTILGSASAIVKGSGIETNRRHSPELATRIPPRTRPFDLICFPIIRWDYRFQRPQQILGRFAEDGYRVFYLSPDLSPGRPPDRVQLRETRERVYEVALPASREIFMVRHSLAASEVETFADAIGEMARDAGVERAASVVQFPFWQPLAELLRRRHGWPIVYDLMDEHSGFPFVEPEVIRLEERLIAGADRIFASSAPLEAKIRRAGRGSIRLPNGVEPGEFGELPESVKVFGPDRPVIGYIGAVSRWIDIPLIGALSRRRPEWSFVLVGGTYGSRIGPLFGRANVHLAGERPYEQLPSILADFDVAIIPFLRSPLTDATNPIKLYEYLAAGKPVVASRIPEAERFGDNLYLAEGIDEFETQIVRALAEDGPRLRTRRRNAVRGDNWAARVDLMEKVIADLFARS
jgi:glycosyltransferase involved in cell wall biosynthesis